MLLPIILVSISVLAFFLREHFYTNELTLSNDKLWRVTFDINAKQVDNHLSIKIFSPAITSHLKIIQRTLYHPGFKIKNVSNKKQLQNSFTAISADDNADNLSIEYLVHHSPEAPTTHNNTRQSYELFLKDEEQLQLSHAIIQETLKSIYKDDLSKPLLIDEILTYASNLNLSKSEFVSVAEVIADKKANTIGKALTMVALCRASGIPARIITGIPLIESVDTELHYWVEVLQGHNWKTYDPNYGYEKNFPNNYLPLKIDDTDIIEIKKGELKEIEIAVFQEISHPYLEKSKSLLSIFDLRRLPIELRDELITLLLLPIGVLITVIFRNLIGIHSYGVFTPTILSLALIYTDPFVTSLIFLITCSLAIIGRGVFPNQITHSPRLAIIFTLVALIITVSVSLLNFFGLSQENTIILLPIIILTTLVDRIYRTQEDEGVEIALRRLFWTIVIAISCLPFIQMDSLGSLILKHPEIHLTSLALLLSLSNYKGKKLISLPFLKVLAEPEKKQDSV